MSETKKLDVLSIGDAYIDAFVKLEDANASVEEREAGPKLVMDYGVKVPFDHSEVVEGVGNAANAAVSISRLGHGVGIISNVGSDNWGRDVIQALGKEEVDTRFVRTNPGKKTGYHYILWYKSDRTILIKHVPYDYHFPHIKPTETPAWIYLTSVAEDTLEFHDDIADWLDANPGVKLAFQPGTYQMKFGAERLKRLYQRTNLLFLNREEAVTVGGGKHEDLNDLFDKLHVLGPKTICITDGPDGAYASNGHDRYKMPNYPDPAPPLERTGAGDAFASTFLAATLHGLSIEEALRYAPINSMSVVQKVGAQAGLLTMDELRAYLSHAPESYKPTKL
ncbi:MAG: carbohydrate kinase family protein [Patescibacteria group bacterium]